MSEFNDLNNDNEHNVINIVYDLIAQNPIKGVYKDKSGQVIDYKDIMHLVESVEPFTGTIYFKQDIHTGEQYKLQLTKVNNNE